MGLFNQKIVIKCGGCGTHDHFYDNEAARNNGWYVEGPLCPKCWKRSHTKCESYVAKNYGDDARYASKDSYLEIERQRDQFRDDSFNWQDRHRKVVEQRDSFRREADSNLADMMKAQHNQTAAELDLRDATNALVAAKLKGNGSSAEYWEDRFTKAKREALEYYSELTEAKRQNDCLKIDKKELSDALGKARSGCEKLNQVIEKLHEKGNSADHAICVQKQQIAQLSLKIEKQIKIGEDYAQSSGLYARAEKSNANVRKLRATLRKAMEMLTDVGATPPEEWRNTMHETRN